MSLFLTASALKSFFVYTSPWLVGASALGYISTRDKTEASTAREGLKSDIERQLAQQAAKIRALEASQRALEARLGEIKSQQTAPPLSSNRQRVVMQAASARTVAQKASGSDTSGNKGSFLRRLLDSNLKLRQDIESESDRQTPSRPE